MTDRPTNSPHTVDNEIYDANIIPSETAARIEREGEDYKHVPENDVEGIDTTKGYAVDSEGLVNNYAIEPEMYYEVPGDAKEQLDADAAARMEELADIRDDDETGKLTTEGDSRGKDPGAV
jgi:hypothetical protein